MRHLLPNGNQENYSIAVLVKQNAFNLDLIKKYITSKIESKDVVIFDLKEDDKKKTPVKLIKAYLSNLLPALNTLGTQYIFVADSAYYKQLTGLKKVSGAYGYVHPCIIKGFEHMHVVLGINPKAFYFDPSMEDKSNQGIDALNAHVKGNYKELGTDIIHSAHYPETLEEIEIALNQLHQYPALVCDVETFGLKHTTAGLGSIAFAWNQHEGVAFCCDWEETPNTCKTLKDTYGHKTTNSKVQHLLYEFFHNYKGKLIYHNASFDVKVLIYTLFMEKSGDTKRLLEGLEVMTSNIECTKIITYLATNTTAGNTLGLKPNTQEYTGDYAEDVTDIRKLTKSQLLEYNLKDCLATWYLHNKNYPIMVQDNQEQIYKNIKIPNVRVCLHMELNGMPLDSQKIESAHSILIDIETVCKKKVFTSKYVTDYENKLRKREMVKANLLLKTKQHPLSHFDNITFNLNSNLQLAGFLYEELGFEVTKRTKGGLPATGNKVIKELASQCTDPAIKDLLDALIEYAKVNKLLTSFIPAFKAGELRGDGRRYLYGNFNIGGTVSGRLSCKDPNLQNLPSGTDYAKPIKECFMAPDGWVMLGADMDSMEDKVAALITRDTNKLKVYTDGYDGHSLRAFNYFGDQMPDIEDTLESINSIKKKYPKLRDASKAPTFLLTYFGMWIGLMGLGFTEEEAKSIEKHYHDMYHESDEWAAKKIEQATIDGYVDVAFGLRVRTPILKKSILNSRTTPYQAKAEGRTVGNALGQSYGILNTRAAIEFQERLLASKYALDVLPIAMIHDAIYLICRDDVEVIAWVNKNLIECMSWNELPELAHPTIKMSAELDIFYPSWAEALTLPNNATKNNIFELADKFVEETENDKD